MPTASSVAQGDSQLGSRSFLLCEEGVPGGTRCPVNVRRGLVTQVLKEGKGTLGWGCASQLRQRLGQLI